MMICFTVERVIQWTKFTNTLKLKIYVQSRLVNSESASKINTIIQGDNYITASKDDFQFNWSSTDNNPDSRHPIFARNFDSPGVITDYMSNHFMEELNAGVNDKTVVDPRLPTTSIVKWQNRNDDNEIQSKRKIALVLITPCYIWIQHRPKLKQKQWLLGKRSR